MSYQVSGVGSIQCPPFSCNGNDRLPIQNLPNGGVVLRLIATGNDAINDLFHRYRYERGNMVRSRISGRSWSWEIVRAAIQQEPVDPALNRPLLVVEWFPVALQELAGELGFHAIDYRVNSKEIIDLNFYKNSGMIIDLQAFIKKLANCLGGLMEEHQGDKLYS